MPIIKISGLPADTPQDILQKIEQEVTERIVGMRVLEIDETHVAIQFLPDMRRLGLGSDIFVDAVLFAEEVRTPEVRKEFAERIEAAIHGFFPDSWVEVLSWPFDRAWGFALQKPLAKENMRTIVGKDGGLGTMILS